MNLSTNLNENISYVIPHFGVGKSFDIIGKNILINNRNAYLLMIDGFAKDNIMLFITQRLQSVTDFEFNNISDFINLKIAYMEAEEFTDFSVMESMVLSGAIALMIDGMDKGVIIDAREYPVRSPSEPDLEKVTRGPRDGFVETIIFNTALIRRRIRDPKLTFELKSVGKRSKTNVVVAYIDDLIDKNYLTEINQKIDSIEIDALSMAEKTLSDLLIEKRFFNPLPQVRYTERPDVAAAHLYEGHILILVDTTPSVIILPTTIFHFTQHAEDYYQNPLAGNYIRWVRFIAILSSLFLIPMWYLAVLYPNYLPDFLKFIVPKETGQVSILFQLLILEFGLDLLRISSIHTPSSMTTSLGIIGGLILGELAIKVGWFIPETVLYMAFVGIGTFATPSIEFGMALRIFRLVLLISTGIFKIYGFIASILFILFTIFFTKNSSKKSYTWPLIPLNTKALLHVLFRSPIPKNNNKKK